MNTIIIDGSVVGDPREEIGNSMRTIKFKINNRHFNNRQKIYESNSINCISYGSLADFCNAELFDGERILVTGRFVHRKYITETGTYYVPYILCNTVTKLEQEEYE